jgi:DGQHR domain-containing protein
MAKKIEQLAYAVSLITQGNWRFYTLTMPSDILGSCCYVSNRFDDPVEGFQRRLDKKRAQEIAAYIDEGLGTIPSAVILSAQKAADLSVTGRGKTVQFKNIPQAFLVLDGQHRVYGYSLANKSLRVPVVIYNGLTREQEVKLFIDINTKQRPVPNELLLDIKRLASYEEGAEKLLGQLFDEFNTNSESVLQGWLSPAEKAKGKISRVTFNTAVKPVLTRFSQQDVDVVFAALNSYLSAVRQHMEDKNISDAIAEPTVFKAVLDVFPRIARIVRDRKGEDYDDSDFFDALAPVFVRTRRTVFERPGTSYKELSEKLLKKLDSEVLL